MERFCILLESLRSSFLARHDGLCSGNLGAFVEALYMLLN